MYKNFEANIHLFFNSKHKKQKKCKKYFFVRSIFAAMNRNAHAYIKIIDIAIFLLLIFFIGAISFIYWVLCVEELNEGVMLNVLGRGYVKGSMLNSFGIVFEVSVKQEYPY